MSHAKRILQNTIALYFRMFLTMCVSLYTSRVVLNVLGAADYGVYNVVGGIVVMFYFLNGAMAGGTQRFLNFEMGVGTPQSLRKTFNASLLIHICIAGVILILAETVGLWFVNHKLVIPEHKMTAANWVYQFSILSAMINLTQVPYTAAIISHEKMKIYGYVGILEALLKLGIVFLLLAINWDKLILYGILTFAVALTIATIYRTYCIRNYTECHFQLVKEKKIYKSLIGFSSWNLLGNLSGILTNQGQNILLNLFFGPVVNASRAIATSVNGVVLLLVNGFSTAMNPQITKSYAQQQIRHFLSLVFKSSKFCYYLLFILAGPIFVQTALIMKIWLVNPPEYIDVFCKLTLIDTLIYSVTIPLLTSAQATGDIKIYETTVSLITIFNLPLSFVLLHFGFPPEIVYCVTIFTSSCALIARLIILRKLIGLNIFQYSKKVLMPCWTMFMLAVGPSIFVKSLMPEGFPSLVATTFLTWLITIACVFTFGTTSDEKEFVLQHLKVIKNKVFNEQRVDT